jgi:hypothetical protein
LPEDGRWPIWRSTDPTLATDSTPISSSMMLADPIGEAVPEGLPSMA